MLISTMQADSAIPAWCCTDPDMPAQNLTYTIMVGPDSPDADKFEFTTPSGTAPHTSELKFNFDTDFDNPVQAGPTDNIYQVRVKVTDDGIPALFDTQIIVVEVVDSNENPVITSDGGGDTANVDVPENTGLVTFVTATDPDVPGQCLSFQIIGGADAALFTWGLQAACANDGTGLRPLRFKPTFPDFENPTDANGDNVYEVRVMVKDDGTPNLTDIQLIYVTITDVNDESPIITSADTANAPENSTAVFLSLIHI